MFTHKIIAICHHPFYKIGCGFISYILHRYTLIKFSNKMKIEKLYSTMYDWTLILYIKLLITSTWVPLLWESGFTISGRLGSSDEAVVYFQGEGIWFDNLIMFPVRIAIIMIPFVPVLIGKPCQYIGKSMWAISTVYASSKVLSQIANTSGN